jgi:hypothetical protein
MKKEILLSILMWAICVVPVTAQTIKEVIEKKSETSLHSNHSSNSISEEMSNRKCLTEIPHGIWENWTVEQITELEKNNYNNGYYDATKQKATQYTIPIVFHVIHNGTSVGTDINISQAQINDQVSILNADMKSLGLNNTLCPDSFLSVKADAEITFCLAIKNPTGGVLAEPGIDRMPWSSLTSSSLYPYSQTTMDSIVKPSTIWNPLYYCNVWVTDSPFGKAYATFPSGTTLSCLSSNYGSDTTDGVVCSPYIIGSIGTATAPPYNKGRILVHEIGHWLGLRHINGDTNCGTDCVSDTPPQESLHGGCNSSSSTPYHVNYCGAGTSPNGEMTMNFMDYGDDLCVYMWTKGQKTRMQQSMVQGTYRNQLSAASATLCNIDAKIDEVDFNLSDISIFPNPNNGIFNFEIKLNRQSDLTFMVVSSIGQVVSSRVEKSIINSIIQMDLSHLPKGIYFVNISDNKGDRTAKKIIIE